ncbi:hypothetical protein HK096_004865, partial [Nowakowskiella sp. JEL0078]
MADDRGQDSEDENHTRTSKYESNPQTSSGYSNLQSESITKETWSFTTSSSPDPFSTTQNNAQSSIFAMDFVTTGNQLSSTETQLSSTETQLSSLVGIATQSSYFYPSVMNNLSPATTTFTSFVSVSTVISGTQFTNLAGVPIETWRFELISKRRMIIEVGFVLWLLYLSITTGLANRDEALKRHSKLEVGIAIFSIFLISVPGLLIRGWDAQYDNPAVPCVVLLFGDIIGIISLTYFIVIRSIRVYYYLSINNKFYSITQESEKNFDQMSFSNPSTENLVSYQTNVMSSTTAKINSDPKIFEMIAKSSDRKLLL